jgi:hypothetical protein
VPVRKLNGKVVVLKLSMINLQGSGTSHVHTGVRVWLKPSPVSWLTLIIKTTLLTLRCSVYR